MRHLNAFHKLLLFVPALLVAVGSLSILSSNVALADGSDVKFWMGPSQLSDDKAQADPPLVAMNDQGNGIAVWSQYDINANRYAVWATRFNKSTGWGKPKQISNSVDQASNPRVAINENGDAIVVWQTFNMDDTPLSTVWSNYYDHWHGWGNPVEIQDEAVDAYFPLAAIDEQGNAIAIWNQNNPGLDKTNIYANYYEKVRGWRYSEMIQSDASMLANDSALVMNPKGNAVALWTQFDSNVGQPQSGLVSSSFVKGQGWQSPKFITHEDATSSSIALNEKGNTIAVWTSLNPETFQNNVHASLRPAGKDWGEGQSIQSNSYVDTDNVQAAIDEQGNALVIWRGQEFTYFDPQPNNIYSTTYINGSGWSTDEIVDEASPYSAPQLAMGEQGDAFAVWEKPAPGVNQYADFHDIYAYHYSPVNGWDSNQAIENYSGDSTDPVVAVNEHKAALALWLQTDNDSGDTSIWANRFASPYNEEK
jgi:hypothetical protein